MLAKRKSDGKVIEVEPTSYFNMKTDEEYRRCLFDGKHYKLSELDFNVEEPEEVIIDGWVARDKSGDLFIYARKPERDFIKSYWEGETSDITPDNGLFPDITWESDPLEVTITIKPKKQ